jgi:trimethylamine:corrinoid methyltransferase-like protein
MIYIIVYIICSKNSSRLRFAGKLNFLLRFQGKEFLLIYPMPACGSTGPAGIFSNICLAYAEALSALLLFQVVKPGSPQIYGAASGPPLSPPGCGYRLLRK